MNEPRDDRRIGECVLVSKEALLTKLKSNRDTHREKFLEALAGWQKQVINALERAVEEAKAGRKFRTHISLPQPSDHTSDYDDIIEALEWQQGADVLLDRTDFTRYVRNEWRWSTDFASSVRSYTVA
ncbi:MAG: hypothetical protein O2894_05850 [Planctomycetota bacterium]|nr:hypothetical protein [Planctomycetota bacterium]